MTARCYFCYFFTELINLRMHVEITSKSQSFSGISSFINKFKPKFLCFCRGVIKFSIYTQLFMRMDLYCKVQKWAFMVAMNFIPSPAKKFRFEQVILLPRNTSDEAIAVHMAGVCYVGIRNRSLRKSSDKFVRSNPRLMWNVRIASDITKKGTFWLFCLKRALNFQPTLHSIQF